MLNKKDKIKNLVGLKVKEVIYPQTESDNLARIIFEDDRDIYAHIDDNHKGCECSHVDKHTKNEVYVTETELRHKIVNQISSLLNSDDVLSDKMHVYLDILSQISR